MIPKMLLEQMKKSKTYTRDFGMSVGDGYFEMVREVTDDPDLAMKLVMDTTKDIAGMLSLHEAMDDIPPGDFKRLAKEPQISRTPMTYLFWGIEIGRLLQKQQDAAMQVMEKGTDDPQNA